MPDSLPTLTDLRALLGVGGVAILLALSGKAVLGRRAPPELSLLAGWGVLCCLATPWSALTPFRLYGAIAILAVFGAGGAMRGGRAPGGLWRLALLTVPLWLVMATARPSQIDTWFNLLPNFAYLVDHARLPDAHGPLSYSFLPVAPYNTQFVAATASILSGGLAPNAMGSLNMLLQCAAGLLLARVLAGTEGRADRTLPPWWACAAGLLLAMPLNPGFLPKVFMSGYGEAPIAVATMFAVWLGARLLHTVRAGGPVRDDVMALALVLAALVNIKQSSIGLVLPLLVTLLGLGLLCPGLERRRWVILVAASGAPAMLLFGLWRLYVASRFPGGELTVMLFAQWHIGQVPQIIGGMLGALVKAPALVVAASVYLAACVLEVRRRPWQPAAILLALGAGTALLFNVFLVLTYVSHFPADWAADAHSYRRYLSQLSLTVVLGLVVWLRPWVAARIGAKRRRLIGMRLAVALALLWPFALFRPLRADLAVPQPQIWELAHKAAAFLQPDDRLGLVLPGDDDDALGSLLRGVLLFTPPRRTALDFTVERTADSTSLAELAGRGVTKALVSCAPAGGLAGLPADTAGLLVMQGGTWRPLAVWPYPPHLNDQYFAAWLPHAPLCGHDAFSRAQIGFACRADYPPRISAQAPPARRRCQSAGTDAIHAR